MEKNLASRILKWREFKMIYYTDKAREIAQENIKRLVKVIMEMKSSELSFIDALDISSYLTTLSEEIEKEKGK